MESSAILAAKGSLELSLYRLREAEQSLRASLKNQTEDPGVTRDLIQILAVQGRTEEVEPLFQALAPRAGSNLQFSDLYLWTLGRREDQGPPELIEILQRATTADPDDVNSRMALVENLRKAGRLDTAFDLLEATHDRDTPWRVAKARMLLDSGRLGEALEEIGPEPIRETDPSRFIWNRLKAHLLVQSGAAREALTSLRIAHSMRPDDREVLGDMLVALRLTQSMEELQRIQKQLRARDELEWQVQNARATNKREDPNAMSLIADKCLQLDRHALAAAWLRLGLAKDPLNPDLQKRIYAIEQGSKAISPR